MSDTAESKAGFEGEEGKRRLFEALLDHKVARTDEVIATELASAGQLVSYKVGDTLIEQGQLDRDVFLILNGRVNVLVNGIQVSQRRTGDLIGEISALDPGQRRAATVKAAEETICWKMSDDAFCKIVRKNWKVAQFLLRQANQRLVQRNELVGKCNEEPCVLIISSKEALPIANEVKAQVTVDKWSVRTWQDGVFELSSYTIPDLERALSEVDFAIAVAQPDDTITSRGAAAPAPRDNVTLEIGLAIGRLGLKRTIVLHPSDKAVKLSSDLSGLTTARFRTADPLRDSLAPVCEQIRKHIASYGVRSDLSAAPTPSMS
jgi:predicted nucleotide-binding protein